jgi:hypothetical protein
MMLIYRSDSSVLQMISKKQEFDSYFLGEKINDLLINPPPQLSC